MLSQVVNQILLSLADLGYFGIALGLMIEIIPSEIVLSYGGFMISQGTIGWPLAIVAAVIGGLFSQLFLYWFARYGGRPLILKYGKYVLILRTSSRSSRALVLKVRTRRHLWSPFHPGRPSCHLDSGRSCQDGSNEVFSLYGACDHSVVDLVPVSW